MSAARDTWSALASPVRRRLLDELRDSPKTTGELAEAFSDLSRFAVMQHLGVLEQAGLIVVRRQGRHRMNHLNPAPLQEIRERWLNRFSDEAGRTAVALRRHVETTEEAMTKSHPRSVRIESELTIRAPRDRVFRALAHEQHDWYPHTYGGDRVRSIIFEPRVGGSCYEDWGDGAGHHYGIITHYDPPVALTLRGGLAGSTVLENAWTLAEEKDATIVRHSMTAFGDLSDDDLQGIRFHGDLSRFELQLRSWVEDGTRVAR